MKVNSLAFDTSLSLNAKASSPNEATQSPKASAKSEPPVLEKIDSTVQAPQKPIVNGMGLGLEFAVDKTTGLNIIRVYNLETGEVIRQIPPEEVLNFLREFESRNGHFFSRSL
jgi:flagellar protein FlaG